MNILGFQSESFQDWPGGLCSIIFTGKCNYRCPACYAGSLVRSNEGYNSEDVIKRLERKKAYINRVTICGGEPTLEKDLPEFMKKLRDNNFLIKLDTNGSNPDILEEILNNQLVDYVAMDIKGAPNLYGRITGIDEKSSELKLIPNMEKSIRVIQKAPAYEFKTTLFPIYKDEQKKDIRWMTKEEALSMADWVSNLISGDLTKINWYIQKFSAKSKEEMIDPRFAKENVSKEYLETPEKLMQEFQDTLRTKFPNARIR